MIPTNRVAKFLVYANNKNEIYYEFGRHNIYVDAVKLLKKLQDSDIYIVKVIFDKDEYLDHFLSGSDLRYIRSFKTGLTRNGKIPLKFGLTVSKNLCGLLKGQTIRVKSKDKVMQKNFYNMLSSVNDEFAFGCKFDFDAYDVTFDVKPIKLDNGKTMLFTYFYGDKYPNYKVEGMLK